MNLTHIHAFIASMQRKDLDAMLAHMSDGIVLNTPLMREPVRGKAAIREVVSALLAIVDTFDFREVMQGPHHASSFFKVTVGPETLDGMDFWSLDEAGMIAEMTVLWRPLPAIQAVQRRLEAAS